MIEKLKLWFAPIDSTDESQQNEKDRLKQLYLTIAIIRIATVYFKNVPISVICTQATLWSLIIVTLFKTTKRRCFLYLPLVIFSTWPEKSNSTVPSNQFVKISTLPTRP